MTTKELDRATVMARLVVICATTPAANGRVERAHQTLQERLVKELRLRGICDREAGNSLRPLGSIRS